MTTGNLTMTYFLEYHHAASSLNKKIEWVKGHQDDGKEWQNIIDLKYLKRTPVAYLNTWCDHQAASAHKTSISIF